MRLTLHRDPSPLPPARTCCIDRGPGSPAVCPAIAKQPPLGREPVTSRRLAWLGGEEWRCGGDGMGAGP